MKLRSFAQSNSSRLLYGLELAMLLCLFNKTGLTQADLSMSELEEKAFEHFTAESWEEAHRSYAELLSLDGTNSGFQMRYAATLLHDSRLRAEGVQRLAALSESDKLRGEGLYWWGRACLFDGNSERAEAVLKDALEVADKRAFGRRIVHWLWCSPRKCPHDSMCAKDS